MSKKKTKDLSITVTSEIAKKLNEGSYNINKLVNKLLEEYLKKNK